MRPVGDQGWGRLTMIRLPGGGDLGLSEPRRRISQWASRSDVAWRPARVVELWRPVGQELAEGASAEASVFGPPRKGAKERNDG